MPQYRNLYVRQPVYGETLRRAGGAKPQITSNGSYTTGVALTGSRRKFRRVASDRHEQIHIYVFCWSEKDDVRYRTSLSGRPHPIKHPTARSAPFESVGHFSDRSTKGGYESREKIGRGLVQRTKQQSGNGPRTPVLKSAQMCRISRLSLAVPPVFV